MASADRRRQRKERQQRKEREKDRTPDPWMDGFGVGAGRKELNRLMVLYGRGKQVGEKATREPSAPTGHSKMVNLSKIERIVAKLPWERRADEVGMVQREISSLEVYRNLRVSAAAELDICRIVTLREVEPNEYVLRQGDVGDSFNIIIEGILERGTMEDGKPCKQDEYLAGEMFGQESLINENNVSSVYVLCTQPTKLLEIKREYFMRYIRPAQRAEWDRIAKLVSELTPFNEPDAVWDGKKLDRLLESLQLQTYHAGEEIISEGNSSKKIYFIVSGHCHVTKHVEDLKKKKKAALLPSPLKSNLTMTLANNRAPSPDGRDIDIVMLYRGSVLDAEAALEMKPCTYTATAMSLVEVAFIDTGVSIFIDEPVLDPDTQSKLKKLGRCLPSPDELQAKCQMDSSWGFFRNHLFCHLIYRKRKEIQSRAGSLAAGRGGVKRDDLIPDVPLDNPPTFNWESL